MNTLLISTLLYLIGIALVLYFRPALMFHKDGRWKEFTLQQEDGTYFPFWAFCMVWAFVSFILTGFLLENGEATSPLPEMSTVPRTMTAAASLASASNSLTRHLNDTAFVEPRAKEDLVQPLPVPATERKRKPAAPPLKEESVSNPFGQPGYYRLDEAASARNGVPRYIYVGPDMPAEETSEEA